MAKNERLIPPVQPDDYAYGPAKAPITEVQYGDYECPASRQVYEAGPQAGGLAAEAAARQGAFWSLHKQLFAPQDQPEDGHLRTHAAANSPLMLFCGPSATRPRWGARPMRRTQKIGRAHV